MAVCGEEFNDGDKEVLTHVIEASAVMVGAFSLDTNQTIISYLVMKVSLTVPTSLDDIPLGQYQDYYKIYEANKDGEDNTFIQQKMLSIFCDVSFEDVRKLPATQCDLVATKLAEAFEQKPKFKRIITISGQKFGLIPNFDKITMGEFVDLDEYAKDVSNYHKMMAVLYRPIVSEMNDSYKIEEYDGTDKFGELMKSASTSDTLGVFVFFWTLGSDLLGSTAHSLKGMAEKINTESESSSGKSTDGIKQSTISQAVMLLESAQLQMLRFTNAYSSLPTTKRKVKLNNEN